MKHLVFIVALAAFNASAFAEGAYQSEAELRLVAYVSIDIENGVDDGCLSNPNALKVEAELILRRSGISVVALDQLGPQYLLQINAFGYEIEQTGSCDVALNVELWRFEQAPEGHITLIVAWMNSKIITGGTKAGMQESLRAQVSELVSDLANEILKAQGN
jgi:hypothetical protein